jgi:hypothetical protein
MTNLQKWQQKRCFQGAGKLVASKALLNGLAKTKVLTEKEEHQINMIVIGLSNIINNWKLNEEESKKLYLERTSNAS